MSQNRGTKKCRVCGAPIEDGLCSGCWEPVEDCVCEPEDDEDTPEEW